MLEPLDDNFYPYYEDTVTESSAHFDATVYLCESLRAHLRDRPDAYAYSNMFIYDEPGNPKRKVAPDVFVCFGCDRRKKLRVYKTWEDGGPPVAVIEVTSKTSRRTDQVVKRQRYNELGVQEYLLFDPLGEYLRPGKLRVFRREGGELVPTLAQERYSSELLGVEMIVEGDLLRLIDLETREPYWTSAELHAYKAASQSRTE